MTTVSMGDIPAHYARLTPERTALITETEAVTFDELDRRARVRALALRQAGVGPNDLVTLALPNGATLYEFTFAAWKIGATPHVVSPRLPEREFRAIVETARPKALVASDPSLVALFNALDGRTPPTGDAIPVAPSPVARHWKAMSSGGSTGRPKVIVDHMPSIIDTSASSLSQPYCGVIVNPGPLYHNAPFAVTHRALFRGCTVVGMERFDAEKTLHLIQRHRANWICLVPTMMLRIWRLRPEVRDNFDLSSLTHVWHMAAPMPAWLKRAWIDWLGPSRIWELYAGTEAQGLTMISGDEWLAHPGSVGKPVRSTMRILDASGLDLPAGEIGEIYMRPETADATTYHYIGAQPKTGPDGYESLGDFGWMDTDGYLYIADRRTDLILRGGANIYPAEVEAALMQHPSVDTAVVIGLPDDDLGARVHAIVRLAPGFEPNEQALRAFASGVLATYKTPASYEFVETELRDEAGKVRRSQLREERINPS